MNRCGEQATISVINKVDFRPNVQSPLDTRTKAPIRQHSLCRIGDQDRVADNGVAETYFLNGQIVGQMAGTNDFDTVETLLCL